MEKSTIREVGIKLRSISREGWWNDKWFKEKIVGNSECKGSFRVLDNLVLTRC